MLHHLGRHPFELHFHHIVQTFKTHKVLLLMEREVARKMQKQLRLFLDASRLPLTTHFKTHIVMTGK